MKLSKSTVKLAVAAAGVTVAAAGSIAAADSAHAFSFTEVGDAPNGIGNGAFNNATNNFDAGTTDPGSNTISGSIAKANLANPLRADLFRFVLGQANSSVTFKISGSNPLANLGLELYTAPNTPFPGFTTNTPITLAAGEYFLRVTRGLDSVSGAVNYTASVNVVPEPISMLSGAAAIATAGMMRRKKKLQQKQAEA
jgi:hypothetical protein